MEQTEEYVQELNNNRQASKHNQQAEEQLPGGRSVVQEQIAPLASGSGATAGSSLDLFLYM